MSLPKIKIGQIGVCHEHAGAKMQALRQLTDLFEIVGVVDDRDTTAARFAGDNLEPYDGLTWMTEDQLLNTPDLQAVLVETPNTDLVPAAMRCMKRNLAMHMDKPGGEDLALFRTLLDGCKERQLPFQMGYMFRSNPAMRFAIKAVHDGWLGDVFEIQASMSHDYGGDAYQPYMGQFKGGIMFNLGCHLIDLMVQIMGRPTCVTPFLKTTAGLDDAIKNNCMSVLEYSNALVTVRACSKEVKGHGKRNLKICGTNGSIELVPLERFDGQPLQLQLTLKYPAGDYAEGVHTVDFGIKTNRYTDQLTELADIIHGKITNPFTYEHDALVQEVVLAAAGYRQL
ncbi:MAG: dehydrogenase [Phycisphaeraceae bacterium]|nr:dehydrogenase [Phycisphaeraceae bacterium]